MTIKLLPDNFDSMIEDAVRTFWTGRGGGSKAQGGTRGGVLAGKNLDGFVEVVRAVADRCGVPQKSVYVSGRKDLVLPGYFRPNKNWDVVILNGHRLTAVLEFKSQVGSFGNNFNNRSEEVIGNGSDFKVAASKGTYHPSQHLDHDPSVGDGDPRPPFLGYLMLLQDCDESTRPVRADSPHYHLMAGFEGASYADRYRILCERLMEQQLYQAASLMLTPQITVKGKPTWRSLSEATDVRNLFTKLAATLLASTQA